MFLFLVEGENEPTVELAGKQVLVVIELVHEIFATLFSYCNTA